MFIQRTKLLSRFVCLGDKCADTCCHGWSMQVDDATLKRYQTETPELMDAVEPGERGTPWIMKKDAQSGYCVKLEGGLCGIHKKFGDSALGDACYFYPRITRRLGDLVVMSASASCPEAARLFFADEDAFALEASAAGRLPYTIKNYLPEELTPEEALAVHRAFLAAADDKDANMERIFARIASASRSLMLIKKADWPRAVPFYLKNADMRLPEPAPHPMDPFKMMLALAGLIVASHKQITPRLRQTMSDMEKALGVTIDWQRMTVEGEERGLAAYHSLKRQWDANSRLYDTLLRRWLKVQLSLALYPFAGLGESLAERVTIIGVRLATFKLAFICALSLYKDTPPEETAVRVAQSLARFLDHLGDPSFSLAIYNETGWTDEARMRGLLEGEGVREDR